MKKDWPGTSPLRGRRLNYAMVLTPLLTGNALMLLLCLLGFHLLSATRAYVGGESQWSKARVQAVQHLRAYAEQGRESDLRGFDHALQVPLGDREARLALDRPLLDWQRAASGLLRGGNAEGDVGGMIRLYRWFGHSPLMAEPVQAWRDGDALIAQLQQLAGQLRAEHAAPASNLRPLRLAATVAEIDQLDHELLSLEQRFSHSLGVASRQAFWVLGGVVGLTTLLLTLTTYALARAGLRRQTRYERALEDANRRWSLAAESDQLGLFEWRQASNRVVLDARACAVYGLACDPGGLVLPCTRLSELLPAEDLAAMKQRLELALENGGNFHHRYRVRTGPGHPPRHLAATGTLSGSRANGDLHMVGVVKDVSAEVQQAQLALDKAAAERSAKARMEFLSRLSHELRTPLNAVLGFSELLLMNSAPESLSPHQRRSVEMIQGAGRHLLHLVNDVLDISSIDAGHFSMAREPTPLAPVLQEALNLSAAEAQEHGVELRADALPPALAVLGDAQRLSQVLANLLSNACKYNRAGGQARVRAREQEGRVLIEVEDQGAGLAETELAQLFQPFKRLPATAHLRGTGLGLSIVKLLVEQMGGRIAVRSRPGQGTLFTLDLPGAAGSSALRDAAEVRVEG